MIVYPIQVALFVVIAVASAYGVEHAIRWKDPSFRQSGVGASLNNSPFVRYSYLLLWVVWLASHLAPASRGVMLVTLAIVGGGATIGVDLLLCDIAHSAKEAKENAREALPDEVTEKDAQEALPDEITED